ncbi:MAG: HlyD family secretion protein [Halioglobus sp.]|nr:HlyD family secretion protein [Halioglobus sp.]
MTDEDPSNTAQNELPGTQKPRRGKQLFLWILGPAIVLIGGGWYALTSGRYESTDNAYLHADIVTIAPEVSGRVVELLARENQRVHAGDPLFQIDSRPFELAVSELAAQIVGISEYLDSSRQGYASTLADLSARRADLSARQANLRHAQQQFKRVEDLRMKAVVSAQVLDDAANAVETAQADVESASADVDAAVAAVAKSRTLLGGDSKTPVSQLAAYQVVQARLEKAQLDLSRTIVRAPIDGVIGTESLQVGDYVAIGQATMPLVSDTVWIDANFKETDMTWVRSGQSATVRIDAYPGREWRAEVSSISPASSAMFSLLPAQNATGNWVKVVQRIPVRLQFINPDEGDSALRAGMSTVVEIDTGSGHTLADRWFGRDDATHAAAARLASNRGGKR